MSADLDPNGQPTPDEIIDALNAASERQINKLLQQKTKELRRDLIYLKGTIGNDYRADEFDKVPGMQITIATNDDFSSWALQTGDNSFTGACYGLPHWEVISLYRRSNCTELAKEAISNLASLVKN